MYINDIIEESLEQDDWSLTKPVFGKESQLLVVGFLRIRKRKEYVLKCETCANDPELFGNNAYFTSLRNNLEKGQIPCGCGKSPRWTVEQYKVLCDRAARSLGWKFLGFHGEWKGFATKLALHCETHGEWNSGFISSLINRGSGCPLCRNEIARQVNLKDDEILIKAFLSTGAFHPDTRFSRSDRKDKSGRKVYWSVYCPECDTLSESKISHLQQGSKPCDCTQQRQKNAYISKIYDRSEIIALKFGISINPEVRFKQQNLNCIYNMELYRIYEFESTLSCKNAERECLQELECGVIPKTEMMDGWTETTWTYNLDKIIEIYERNAGNLKKSFD